MGFYQFIIKESLLFDIQKYVHVVFRKWKWIAETKVKFSKDWIKLIIY